MNYRALTPFPVGQFGSPPGSGAKNSEQTQQPSNLHAGLATSPPSSFLFNRDACPPRQIARPQNPPASPPKVQASIQQRSTVPSDQSSISPSLSIEMSAVDLKWGVLFDQQGLPTKRWEQVIKGLGKYLVSQIPGRQKRD